MVSVRLAFAGTVGYCLLNGWRLPSQELALALGCTALAFWPAFVWAKNRAYAFPAFEAFMLTTITSYILPVINGHEGVMAYSPEVIDRSLLCVLLFQICALTAFFNTRALEKRTPFWTDPLFTGDPRRWLPIGLWLNVFYMAAGQFTTLIPPDFDSVLRAVFFGLATVCLFLIGRYWGEGSLSSSVKTSAAVALVMGTLLQLLSLYMIAAISGILVYLLAYISAGRKAPWVGLVVLFACFSVLQNGKAAMRDKYWAPGAPAVGVTDVPSFFAEWVQDSLSSDADTSKVSKKNKLIDRASLLQMLCLVVDSTQDNLPYLMGDTYENILPQLVPRLFWPNKPSGQVTTRRLSIYFGLQSEDASQFTSIAFGVLAEAYANFGMWGSVLLGLVIGWASKVISLWTRGCPMLSNGGLIMILVMAWSVQIELPASVWISSIYQAGLAMLIIPYVLRPFLA